MPRKQKPQIFFTCDQHFGHDRIIEYCNRPFSSVGEMDSVMIERWNWVVRPKDIVFYPGDFCLGNQEMAFSYFKRLNGQIYVVPGGHDKRWIRPNLSYMGPNCVVRMCPPLHTVTINKQVIVLCHYPLRTWDRSCYDSIHCHGHSHGRLPPWPNSVDVGVDSWDFYPASLEEVKKMAQGELTGSGAMVRGPGAPTNLT